MGNLLPTAFAALEQSVALFSTDGAPLECNPSTESLLGYTQSEFTRISLPELIAPRADLTANDIHTHIREATEGSPRTFEWQLQRANGEPRWVEVTASSITLKGTRYVVLEIEDLTDYKAQERRLQLLYRVLRHNLRNEMTVIHGYADNLQDAIEADNLEKQIDIIKDTAEEVGGLSQSVADLERLVEADATDRVPVEITAMLQAVASEVEEEYPEAHIEVNTETETWVSADKGFRLALEHALRNAVEHNGRSEPKVSISQKVVDGEAIISFADNGPGIPEIEIKALESTPTQTEHGKGLGLSVIQWCTQSLGGDISIETTVGDGSVLKMYLPELIKDRE